MAFGRKTGGRSKGTPNKATAQRQAEIKASGLTPLEYMLSIMRDESQPSDVRLDAAKSAAPYVHPRLSAIEANIAVSTHEDFVADLELMAFSEEGGEPCPH